MPARVRQRTQSPNPLTDGASHHPSVHTTATPPHSNTATQQHSNTATQQHSNTPPTPDNNNNNNNNPQQPPTTTTTTTTTTPNNFTVSKQTVTLHHTSYRPPSSVLRPRTQRRPPHEQDAATRNAASCCNNDENLRALFTSRQRRTSTFKRTNARCAIDPPSRSSKICVIPVYGHHPSPLLPRCGVSSYRMHVHITAMISVVDTPS